MNTVTQGDKVVIHTTLHEFCTGLALEGTIPRAIANLLLEAHKESQKEQAQCKAK